MPKKNNEDKDDPKSRCILTKKDQQLLNKKRKYEAFLTVCNANDEDGRTRRGSKQKSTEKEDVELTSNSSSDQPEIMIAVITPLRAAGSVGSRPSKRQKINDDNRNADSSNGQTREKIEEELKAMRAQISRRKRAQNPPMINLTDVGRQAQFQLDAPFDVVPLFLSDLRNLLLVAMFGQLSPRQPRWCKMARSSALSHVTVVLVEGCSVIDYRKHVSSLKWAKDAFEMIFEVLPSQQFKTKAIDEILSIISMMKTNTKFLESEAEAGISGVLNKLESFFKIALEMKNNNKQKVKDKFPRTHLLLTPEQMLTENYPFNVPGLRVEEGFVFTKDEYAQVTPNSPLFGVDCEMCITESGENELARISIVDEELNEIYDELVKPRNKIQNYLTRFSGITAKMLENVTTRIEDVQQDVRQILPSDAILCGQSLNMDLRAMKMMHPYVIDTSIIYNLSGVRQVKSSLKNLTKHFLNKDIQNNYGHNSIEDSQAVVQLVQLKLANSINFGNATVSPEKESNGFKVPAVRLLKKKVAVITSPELSPLSFPTDGANFTVNTIQCSSNKDVVSRTREVAIENNLAIAHMMVSLNEATPEDVQRKFSKLDKRLRKIYESCAINSLFVVMFADSTRKSDVGYYENGVFMLQIKPPLS